MGSCRFFNIALASKVFVILSLCLIVELYPTHPFGSGRTTYFPGYWYAKGHAQAVNIEPLNKSVFLAASWTLRKTTTLCQDKGKGIIKKVRKWGKFHSGQSSRVEGQTRHPMVLSLGIVTQWVSPSDSCPGNSLTDYLSKPLSSEESEIRDTNASAAAALSRISRGTSINHFVVIRR